MKAILVIDVPSDYGDIADNKAIVTLRNDKLGTSLRIHNVPLKPMPKKKETDSTGTIEEYMLKGYDRGWNDCLKEICDAD